MYSLKALDLVRWGDWKSVRTTCGIPDSPTSHTWRTHVWKLAYSENIPVPGLNHTAPIRSESSARNAPAESWPLSSVHVQLDKVFNSETLSPG